VPFGVCHGSLERLPGCVQAKLPYVARGMHVREIDRTVSWLRRQEADMGTPQNNGDRSELLLKIQIILAVAQLLVTVVALLT
jgi:hypothetical protein